MHVVVMKVLENTLLRTLQVYLMCVFELYGCVSTCLKKDAYV